MATRYKDRITILEDAEIEELYGRPRFTHDERVHYFALTPEERAVADGHYSLASRVLFILQAGYFKAKTLFFSFEIDEVADDVKHVLQQHYPQYHDTGVEIGDRQTDPPRATAQTAGTVRLSRLRRY